MFEILASFTASSVGVFSILLAIRVLHWPAHHSVWLMAVQGLSCVLVLLFLGRFVLASRYREQLYGGAHLAIMAALLILGLWPNSIAYLAASVLLGLGLGVNNLVNTDNIARAPVDKARVSAHLTLFGMVGGTAGAAVGGPPWRLTACASVPIWLAPWRPPGWYSTAAAGLPGAARRHYFPRPHRRECAMNDFVSPSACRRNSST